MYSTYEEQLNTYGTLVYTNVGDSMMPLLRQNRDLMMIRSLETDAETGLPKRCRKYDAVLYKRPSGQYVLHRILKVRAKDYVICGDNRWRREYGVPDAWILGVLTAVVRDGKEIPVTDRRYQLYVHLWCDFFYVRAVLFWLRDLPGRVKRKFGKLRKGR